MFGVPDSVNEQLTEKVNEVFLDIGEKPCFEVIRLGRHSSSSSPRKARPVKVTFSSSSIATHILSRSPNLKKSAKYQSVFICPDMSPEQRAKRRELVLEKKSLAAKEPDKKHFIRRGTVCSVGTKTKG